jgi:hypothetical protein
MLYPLSYGGDGTSITAARTGAAAIQFVAADGPATLGLPRRLVYCLATSQRAESGPWARIHSASKPN